MAEEFFFHYTSMEAATQIILDGKIRPSLAADGDAIHGDGVYLTTLEPKYGLPTIMNNNWDGAAVNRSKVETRRQFRGKVGAIKLYLKVGRWVRR